MSKNLEKKQTIVAELKKELENQQKVNAFVFNYTALKSDQLTELKKELHQTSAKLNVVKNTLIHRIFESLGIKLETKLEGQNALLIPQADVIAPLKKILDYSKKAEKGSVIMGILDNNIINSDRISQLSMLPGKNELIAKMLGGFNAPIRGFAYSLTGVQSNFVRVISAIKDKKVN